MAHYAVEISYMDSTEVGIVDLPDATHDEAVAAAMKIASGVAVARSAGNGTWEYAAGPDGQSLTVDVPTFLDARAVEHEDH